MERNLILKEALALPDDARADLAVALLESLETSADADAEESWRIEVRKRLAELDSGDVAPIAWHEVSARLPDLSMSCVWR